MKECLGSKIPEKKCLFINGDSNEKLSLKLSVPKFQK